MATPKEYSETFLNDFPGYEAYFIVHVNGAWGLGKSNSDQILFKYYCRYGRYQQANNYHDLVKDSNLPNVICGTSDVSESDCFLVHPSCIVPRSLVSIGKVLNKKSPEVPTKIVVPYNYIGNMGFWKVVPMVNYDDKVVLLVINELDEGNTRGTEVDWLNALPKSPDLVNSFPQCVLDNFTMPYGKSMFLLSNLCDIDTVLLNGLVSPDMVVCENRLTTGDKPLTVDVLYSCYKMLDSTDNQIVESACNMLARNRFNKVDALVGWLLRTYRSKIGYYRSKSTAFKWLWFMCHDKYRIPLAMKQAGKELVIRITNNDIHWDDDTMVVTKASWFDDSSIRALVDLINRN